MTKEERIQELIEKIDELKEELEELQKTPYEISYPEHKTKVYYINHNTGVIQNRLFNIIDEDDKHLYDIGLLFDSEEEAEQFIRKQTLIKKIKSWAKEQQDGCDVDWGEYDEEIYEIQFDRFPRYSCDDQLEINNVGEVRSLTLLPYFKRYKLARECIDEFGEEILGVFC